MSALTELAIDLAAASRISRRVDLREIRLTDIHATCQPRASGSFPLIPTYDHTCVPTKVEGGIIEVSCTFRFKVRSSDADADVADASMTYQVIYRLLGDGPTEQSDIEHFARANGAYHTWPFVRETIYSLTSKMGFPPYTLPVLSFLPRPKPRTVSEPNSELPVPAARVSSAAANQTAAAPEDHKVSQSE